MCGCGCGTFPEGPQGVQGPAGLDGTDIHYVATDAAVAGIVAPNEGDVAVVTSNGNEYEYVSGVWTARLKNMWQTATLGTGTEDVLIAAYDQTVPTGRGIVNITGDVRYRFINDTFIYQITVTDLDVGVDVPPFTPSDFNELTFDFTNVLSGVTVPSTSSMNMIAVWDGTDNDPSYTTTRMYHYMDTSKFVHCRREGAIFSDPATVFTKAQPNGMILTGIVKVTWP